MHHALFPRPWQIYFAKDRQGRGEAKLDARFPRKALVVVYLMLVSSCFSLAA